MLKYNVHEIMALILPEGSIDHAQPTSSRYLRVKHDLNWARLRTLRGSSTAGLPRQYWFINLSKATRG